MNTDIILFNSRDELLRVDTEKIVYFEACGNYTTLVTANKLKYALHVNLSGMERLLEQRLKERSSVFARIGKSYIINLRYVTQINLLKHKLILSDFNQCAYMLDISKEALKNLKNTIIKLNV